jgi:hypothetical protein
VGSFCQVGFVFADLSQRQQTQTPLARDAPASGWPCIPIHLSNRPAFPRTRSGVRRAGTFLRSRGALLRPGFALFLLRPDEGRRSAEKARGFARPPGPCCEHGPGRVRGAPRPLAIGDARLSALHRRFSDAVPRFRALAFPPGHRAASSSQSGRSARRAVSAPPEATLRAPPRERRPRSTFRNASGRRPL